MQITINTNKLLRFLSRISPRGSLLWAIWFCEKALELAPNTEEGRVLQATLSNYFLRKELIEQKIYTPDEETHKLALEAREHQSTLRLLKKVSR